MARSLFLSVFLLAGGAGAAWADCSAPAETNLAALLGNQLVCASKVSGEQYQEEHIPGGNLIERARGPNDPVDPSYDAGSWSLQGGPPESVCYTYGESGGGGTFCFTVHPNTDGSYSFCEGPAESARGVLFPLPAVGVVCNPPAISSITQSPPSSVEPG